MNDALRDGWLPYRSVGRGAGAAPEARREDYLAAGVEEVPDVRLLPGEFGPLEGGEDA